MKSQIDCELEALAINKAAYEASITRMEANPDHAPNVLAMEKTALQQINARIDELTKIKAAQKAQAATPTPAPEATAKVQ